MNMYRLLVFVPFFLAYKTGSAQSTFSQVYDLFQQKCSGCHNTVDAAGGLDLTGVGATAIARRQSVFGQLVGTRPDNAKAALRGDKRVYPGRMDKSFLFRKINHGLEPTLSLENGEGDPMPAEGSGQVLSDPEKELVRQWILFGAPFSGEVVSTSLIESYYTSGGLEAFPGGPPSAPAPGEGFQVKMGPFFLEPGGEVEYFQKWALELPENVDVTRIDFQISNYSHHFLLYYFENGGTGVPDGLRLNQDHSDIGLFAAVQERTDLDLPTGAAFRWQKDIVLDLNSHYINYSFTQVYKAEVYLNVYTQAGGTAAQEMESVLLANPAIYIPNDGTPRTFRQPIFFSGKPIYVWGMMGHTHKYGTDYKAYLRNPDGSPGELIYDASCAEGIPGCVSPYFDYQHIPMRYFSPLMPLPVNPGLIHEATYINDGPRPVRWGGTSDDEMMILILMFTRDTAGIISSERPVMPVKELEVSPNPAEEEWHIQLPAGSSSAWNYQLIRLDGTVATTGIFDPSEGIGTVTAAGLADGIYFCRFVDRSGRYFMARLVKAAK